MIALMIRVLQFILLIILMVLVGKIYTYFDMLPESNKYKCWLACDIIVLIGFIIYIGVKLICK